MNVALAVKFTFTGEPMVCILCGLEQVSDPKTSSDWRCIEIDGRRFYACAAEFPPDTARASEFAKVYMLFIRAAIEQLRGAK